MRLLTVDAERRISADAALEHPFVAQRQGRGAPPRRHLHASVDEMRKFNHRRTLRVSAFSSLLFYRFFLSSL